MKQRSAKAVGVLFVFLTLGATAEENAKIRAKATVVKWSALEGMDYLTGSLSKKMRKLVGKPIKIRGYAMPLEATGAGVSSIFLVSDPMFCSHVAPPLPNQLILVEFKEPLPWRVFEQSLWLTGTLRVIEQRSDFGAYGYQMTQVAGVEKGGW